MNKSTTVSNFPRSNITSYNDLEVFWYKYLNLHRLCLTLFVPILPLLLYLSFLVLHFVEMCQFHVDCTTAQPLTSSHQRSHLSVFIAIHIREHHQQIFNYHTNMEDAINFDNFQTFNDKSQLTLYYIFKICKLLSPPIFATKHIFQIHLTTKKS